MHSYFSSYLHFPTPVLTILSNSHRSQRVGKTLLLGNSCARNVPEHWSVVQCEIAQSDVCFVLRVKLYLRRHCVLLYAIDMVGCYPKGELLFYAMNVKCNNLNIVLNVVGFKILFELYFTAQ